MSDFPEQQPDWSLEEMTTGTPTFDSSQAQRAGNQSGYEPGALMRF